MPLDVLLVQGDDREQARQGPSAIQANVIEIAESSRHVKLGSLKESAECDRKRGGDEPGDSERPA